MENTNPEPAPEQPPKASPKKNRRYMTPRKLRFVKGLVEGKSIVDSALQAGFGRTYRTAASYGSQLNKQPEIQELYKKELENQGLTPEFVVENLKKGITEGKKGTTDAYLKIAMKLQGVKDETAAPSQSFISVIINSTEQRGLQP